ncbi:MAG: glycoside hydrolase family 16 protein [Oscillospiraceae bacterium]|nr:glycoside hydrolase family 16 protein [Oscillospiraceae bacterium]
MKSKKSLRYVLLAIPLFILQIPLRIYAGLVDLFGYAVPFFVTALRRPKTPKGPKLDLGKFRLTWSDEFDSNRLDLNKWSNWSDLGRDGPGDVNERAQPRHDGWSCLDMARVEDGRLHIATANSEEGMAGGPPGSYAAAITTRHTFRQKYGYFEARCKCPKGLGLWSAFWLHNEKVTNEVDGTGRPGTEIDVMESPFCRSRSPRRRDSIPSSLHYGSYGFFHVMKNVGRWHVEDPYDTFHTYGVEWNERGYIFYIDGVEAGRSKAGGVSRNEQFLILSVEHHHGGFKGLFWAGDVRKNKPEDMTDFEVEYVRVYQYKELLS